MRRTFAIPTISAVLLGLTSCGGDSGPTEPEFGCNLGTPLTLGVTATGTLQAGDALDVDGAYLDRYRIDVGTAGTIGIDMTSDDVDPFLWLRASDGEVLALDDDGGLGLDAFISEPLSAGCYVIEATSADPGETGTYDLIAEAL